ncbi:MAG: hypothetical protein ACR2QT_00915 [Woeseiaceae bacterium]
MHSIFSEVKALGMPLGDYAIFGSGPMLVRNIIESSNDIDIISRGAAWQHAQAIGELVYLENYDVHVVSIDDGLITIGTSWGIGEFDIDELIDTAEIIRDLPFVRLQYVVDYKRIANRPKDLEHLELLGDVDHLNEINKVS